MTEKMIRELISDKDKFMEYVMSTVVTKDVGKRFGFEEKSYKDELGREIFWELNDSYESRQYIIYPSKEADFKVAYFTSDGMIAFIKDDDDSCSEEKFFALVNKI